MTAKGHIALSLLAAIPTSSIIEDYNNKFIFLIAVVFGSLLPDIDEPNSYIGRRFSFIAYPLKILGIKHRTITHYLIFPLFIFLISFFLEGIYKLIAVGIAFGVLMHDIGDLLTKGGIKGFFYPFLKDKTIRLLPKEFAFYTNSITEHIIVFILFLVDVYLYYKVVFNA